MRRKTGDRGQRTGEHWMGGRGTEEKNSGIGREQGTGGRGQ